MTPQTIESIMADLAAGERLDFADLSIREADARALMAVHFCEVDRQLAAGGLGSEERLTIMAAIAAQAMVENMLLNVQRLRQVGSGDGFRDWLRRHRLDGGA